MAIGNLYDNGSIIRRWRRSPHLSSERERVFLNKLQIDLEVGLGPQPPLTGLQPGLNQAGVSEQGKLVINDQSGNRYALSVVAPADYLTFTPLAPAVQNPPFYRDPQITLSISRDGSKTFGVEYALNCGQTGNYTARAILRRLGQARDFVFDLVVTDPIPWRIIEGFVEGTGFNSPMQRLPKQLAQVQ
jgi:hypothetical protein